MVAMSLALERTYRMLASDRHSSLNWLRSRDRRWTRGPAERKVTEVTKSVTSPPGSGTAYGLMNVRFGEHLNMVCTSWIRLHHPQTVGTTLEQLITVWPGRRSDQRAKPRLQNNCSIV